jgi:hypothetical protein
MRHAFSFRLPALALTSRRVIGGLQSLLFPEIGKRNINTTSRTECNNIVALEPIYNITCQARTQTLKKSASHGVDCVQIQCCGSKKRFIYTSSIGTVGHLEIL